MPIYALGIRRKTVPTVLIAHARLPLVGVINKPWLQDKKKNWVLLMNFQWISKRLAWISRSDTRDPPMLQGSLVLTHYGSQLSFVSPRGAQNLVV